MTATSFAFTTTACAPTPLPVSVIGSVAATRVPADTSMAQASSPTRGPRRISGGSGFRIVNPVAEFNHWLNTSLDFQVEDELDPERSWGAGTGVVHQFTLAGREGAFRTDYYFTGFPSRVVADADADPTAITIRNADGFSRSHAAQVEVDWEVVRRLEVRAQNHLESLPLQLSAGVQHGLVLDLRGDDVLALLLVKVRYTLDGQVVRFCRSGRPDNLPWIRMDKICNLAPGTLHSFFGLPAV